MIAAMYQQCSVLSKSVSCCASSLYAISKFLLIRPSMAASAKHKSESQGALVFSLVMLVRSESGSPKIQLQREVLRTSRNNIVKC